MEQESRQSGAPTPALCIVTPARVIALILCFGVGVRVYHYLLNPGVWMDELFLLRNIVGKTYMELLGPLECDQAAPPLFLWLEHTAWLLLGESTLALRLIPLLASCGAMLLLTPVARSCVRASALPWALLLFASSDKLVDHTIEAKQYLVDVLVIVLVPAIFLATRDWRLGRRSLLFAAMAPLVIFLAFPGCFAMGGLLLAMLPEVWRERHSRTAWLGLALVAAATLMAFGFLVMGPIRAQHTAALADYWTDTFPNWQEPWTLPEWCVRSNISVLDHSFRPLGGALAPFALLGVASMWRRGCKTELLLVATPIVLVMVAAALRAYPYDSRVALFTVAPFAMLIGEGAVALLEWIQRWRQHEPSWRRLAARRALFATALILLLLPTCLMAYRALNPWPRQVFPWPEARALATGPRPEQ